MRKLRKAVALDFELLQRQKELHKQWGVRLVPGSGSYVSVGRGVQMCAASANVRC